MYEVVTTNPVSNALALFPTKQELELIKEQAQIYINSKLLPKAVDTPEKAILIMLKGRELGIPPLQALAGIYVIEGKTSMGAELMLSQIYKNVPGTKIKFIQNDNQGCVIEATRPGSEPARFSFTMEDAQRAGCLGKDNWRKYPQTMMRWRSISMMAKAVFPDAISNCYTPDELGIEVDATGSMISAPQSGSDKKDLLKEKLGISKPETKTVQAEVVAPEVEPVKDEQTKPESTEINAEEIAFDPVGDFIVTVGPLKDKKLKDVPKDVLKNFFDAANAKAKKLDHKFTGDWLMTMMRIEEYLREPAEGDFSIDLPAHIE